MDGTAIVYAEGAYGTTYGKTAHGLVRHTERYEVLSVIDSALAGRDAGEALDGRRRGIPVLASLAEALGDARERSGRAVGYLVYGVAPDGGRLPDEHRPAVAEALRLGLNVDAGLHTFLSEDPELAAAAAEGGSRIRDVRKPPPREELHFWSGRIREVEAVKIAVLGTDSAVGKRTTAQLLRLALRESGVSAEMVGTGQTAWMQGASYSLLLDSLVNDFVTGEIEHAVWSAWKERRPAVILIEGQGSLTHPGYPGGFEILAAARPEAVVLQHAPGRRDYDGFPGWPVAPPEDHAAIIDRMLGRDGAVAAIALSHEGLSREETLRRGRELEERLGVPCSDPVEEGCGRILAALAVRFPGLRT